jgi:hypothetical protein
MYPLLQAKVALTSSLPQIKVTGGANVVLNIGGLGALAIDANIEITAPLTARLNASINAGIMSEQTPNPMTQQWLALVLQQCCPAVASALCAATVSRTPINMCRSAPVTQPRHHPGIFEVLCHGGKHR